MTNPKSTYWDKELCSMKEKLPIGGKAEGLLRLLKNDCVVPRFFVLLPNEDLASAIYEFQNSNLQLVAVRSSAIGEDGTVASYAGMYETVLGVSDSAGLSEAIKHCRNSVNSERLTAYRAQHALTQDPLAIIIQEMVEGEVSGVLFSNDPIFPDRALISAAYGLGEGVVQGLSPCDTFWVESPGKVQQQLATKDTAMRLVDGKTIFVGVEAGRQEKSCLSPPLIKELVSAGRRLADNLGCPQDIEWTIKDGELVLLQTRPITVPIPKGRRLLWDNSNIIESYYGLTRPLTYSFASRSYTIVYQLFCEVMGVSQEEIRSNSETFTKMIGLIKGRIYYNLNAWYTVVSLLPGYQWNRHFLEQMMGVSEVATDVDAQEASFVGRYSSLLRLMRLSFTLVLRVMGLDRRVRHFHMTVNKALSPIDRKPLSFMASFELVELYSDLERQLLWAWSTPIMNDFFVMIAHGLLKSLCDKWLPQHPDLSNRLIAGAGNMVSARPAQMTKKIALSVREYPTLQAAFGSFSAGKMTQEELRVSMKGYASVEAVYQQYLRELGHRCADELKLETNTFHHDPSPLLKSISSLLVGNLRSDLPPDQGASRDVERGIKGLRRWVFLRVKDWTVRRVRSRENLRYDRTRVFAAVREVFRALGEHMETAGALKNREDVFYLEVEEIFGWVRGTGTTSSLMSLVQLRQKEYENWEKEPAPADRFWTWGPIWRDNHFVSPHNVILSSEDIGITGMAAYPGIVEGTARCIADPNTDILNQGEIMVCYRTDPGWVPLFPAASAILVERGSLLSHSAVVARELGIPTIVAIPGLMDKIQSGQKIRVDATIGTVEILK